MYYFYHSSDVFKIQDMGDHHLWVLDKYGLVGDKLFLLDKEKWFFL